jgi:uncharacterized membrane protein
VRQPEGRGRPSPTLTGVLLGIGVIGFLDEALIHQILQWHTFYWGTTRSREILSDGLFHVVSTLILLWGAARLWKDRADHAAGRARRIGGGALLGAGAFNLYDGLVQHLAFHFHLVNERVCPIVHANNSLSACPRDVPYEIAFDLIAAALVLAGVAVLRRVRRAPQPARA